MNSTPGASLNSATVPSGTVAGPGVVFTPAFSSAAAGDFTACASTPCGAGAATGGADFGAGAAAATAGFGGGVARAGAVAGVSSVTAAASAIGAGNGPRMSAILPSTNSIRAPRGNMKI